MRAVALTTTVGPTPHRHPEDQRNARPISAERQESPSQPEAGPSCRNALNPLQPTLVRRSARGAGAAGNAGSMRRRTHRRPRDLDLDRCHNRAVRHSDHRRHAFFGRYSDHRRHACAVRYSDHRGHACDGRPSDNDRPLLGGRRPVRHRRWSPHAHPLCRLRRHDRGADRRVQRRRRQLGRDRSSPRSRRPRLLVRPSRDRHERPADRRADVHVAGHPAACRARISRRARTVRSRRPLLRRRRGGCVRVDVP